MRLVRIVKWFVVSLACGGLLIPHNSLADNTSIQPLAVMTDVALTKGGILQGQLVDTTGLPVEGADVEVRSKSCVVGHGLTDEKGDFVVSELRGGVYQVVAAGKECIIRAWSPGTAPPVAQRGLLVVAGDLTVRGGAGQIFTNPWLLAFVAALAIGIPLSLDDSKTSSGP